MNKKISTPLGILIILVAFLMSIAIISFSCSCAREKIIAPSEDVDSKTQNDEFDLPIGYTMDIYEVEEVLDVSCEQNSDCQTPAEYMAISRCPMQTICLDQKCTVVCPQKEEQAIDTSDWQTYRSDGAGYYGFEIKYPNDWRVDYTSGNPIHPFVISFESIDIDERIDDRSDLFIDVIDHPSEFSNFEYEKKYFPNSKDLYVDGKPALLTMPDGKSCGTLHIFKDNDSPKINYEYLISGSYDCNVFDQILSTFKFLDEE